MSFRLCVVSTAAAWSPSKRVTRHTGGGGTNRSWLLGPIAMSIALSVGACSNSLGDGNPRLTLSVILGKSTTFEGEPIYVVFKVANKGSDTAWISRFSLVELTLTIGVRTLDGRVVPQQGPVADYFPEPGWRGVPLPPGEALYDVAVLQARTGFHAGWIRNLYAGHLPSADYQVRASFEPSPDVRHPPIKSEPLVIQVRPSIPDEQRLLTSALELANMAWDLESRPLFVNALIESSEKRLAADSLDPFLPVLTGRMVGTAGAVGFPPDSATLDRFLILRERIALGRRNEPAGVIALAGLYFDNPEMVRRLAPQLRGSLTGDVADALSRQPSALSVIWRLNRIEAL